MKKVTIIHHPHCSKSRKTLELIESYGYEAKIINYLNGELTKELVEKIIKLLNIAPQEILRTKEEEYQYLKINFDEQSEVIAAILKYPKLLERPIVFKGEKAVIGRPPENVLTLLKS